MNYTYCATNKRTMKGASKKCNVNVSFRSSSEDYVSPVYDMSGKS